MDDMLELSAKKPAIPTNWDFTKADKEFDGHIHDWRRLTTDVVAELWIFYNKLSSPGKRTDLSPNGDGLPSWKDWLKEKGIGENTPLRHFKALGWAETTTHVSHNSGNNEWYTPSKFVEAAKEVMGDIKTDPASSPIANKTIQAETFYTEEDDGLAQEWGDTVWINPPYSQPAISQFCDALVSKLESGEVKEACALVNNATETVFGQKLLSICCAVCFPSGRIKFLDKQGDAKGAPLQGQMILYFGKSRDKFMREFAEFGVCLHG